MSFALDTFHRHRLIVSLIAEEIGRLRQREVTPQESLSWTEDTLLGESDQDRAKNPGQHTTDNLDLDSLGRIDVAARINQFFHLHEVGIEDYLLIEKTIGRWNFIVGEAFKHKPSHVTFQTSGSTGVPKACEHDSANLLNEANELVEVLMRPRRIISMVPPHHIYGFIFTVLLPTLLQVDVVDARVFSPGKIKAMLTEGDMIVATPHLWRYLSTSFPTFPKGVTGTSSTAPMPADLAESLKNKGLSRLTEIYGSTETAGIAWRDNPHAAFTLFDAWRVSEDQEAISRRIESASGGEVSNGPAIPFVDLIEFEGPGLIRPIGRRDGAVQIGGVNIFPERVQRLLKEHEAVMDVAVRSFSVGGDTARQRLKAFVVPKGSFEPEALEKNLRVHAAKVMSELERPAAYAFGAELPRNAFGKLADWN